jgi:RNA polymerase sigma-70 factor (ECF subfamily)
MAIGTAAWFKTAGARKAPAVHDEARSDVDPHTEIFSNKLWKESFKIFYENHARRFRLFILKTCGDEGMTEDIFQESFFRFLRSAPIGLNEHQQKSYLYKVAYRLILDQKKKFRTETKFRSELYEEPGSKGNPELSTHIEDLFRLLKPKERSLLWLAYAEGFSHREISRLTKDREKSIKVQIFRAKQKFASILRQRGYTWEDFR